MAVAFRSAAATTSGGSSALNATKPAGVVSGDVLLAVMTVDSPVSVYSATGWTIANTIRLTNNDTQSGCWAWKVAGGSEPSTYPFAVDVGSEFGAVISAYTGVDNASPIETSSANNQNLVTPVGNVSAAATGFTTSNADGIVGLYFADGDANLTWGTPAAMAARGQTIAGAGIFCPCFIADFTQSSAGATGNQTATYGQVDNWGAWLVALMPAGAGGVSFPPVPGSPNTLPGFQQHNALMVN